MKSVIRRAGPRRRWGLGWTRKTNNVGRSPWVSRARPRPPTSGQLPRPLDHHVVAVGTHKRVVAGCRRRAGRPSPAPRRSSAAAVEHVGALVREAVVANRREDPVVVVLGRDLCWFSLRIVAATVVEDVAAGRAVEQVLAASWRIGQCRLRPRRSFGVPLFIERLPSSARQGYGLLRHGGRRWVAAGDLFVAVAAATKVAARAASIMPSPSPPRSVSARVQSSAVRPFVAEQVLRRRFRVGIGEDLVRRSG